MWQKRDTERSLRFTGAAISSKVLESKFMKDQKVVGIYIHAERLREVDTTPILQHFVPPAGALPAWHAELHGVVVPTVPLYLQCVSGVWFCMQIRLKGATCHWL